MTTGGKIILIIATIVLIATGAYLMLRGEAPESIPPAGEGQNGQSTSTPAFTHPLIRVSFPSAYATATSPLNVTGEARGNWYFEASFPIRVIDGEGRVIGGGYAEAQSDWMTTSFVPFFGIITFSSPQTSEGVIIFEKDNASGLPENADEFRVPVRFQAETAPNTRPVKLYFYNENRDKDFSGDILCSSRGLVVIERRIQKTNTPIQDTLKELLLGPLPAERVLTPGTEFPLPGFSLAGASLSNGVLTLALEDPQARSTGGSCRVSVLRAQLEATAKQFDGVRSVRFLPVGILEP